MSYDLFAQAFTNATVTQAATRREAMVDSIRPFAIADPDDHGFCRTQTSDGGQADFYLGTTDAGFMVNHFSRGETIELIYQAARAAGLVVLGPELPAALTHGEQLAHLPPELLQDPAPVLVTSGAELEGLITGDAEIYRLCRDRLSPRR